MIETLTHYGIGIAGIVVLVIAWVGIQALWRKIFDDYISDTDVLAGRQGCGNCGCTTACSIKKTKTTH